MIDTITLTSGRSLIAPNVTDKFKHCEGKSCKVLTEDSINKFGLFEANSPNFNTYYPDVTAEDLNPKEDEFVYPLFRALTATTVRKQLPIDFSQGSVLKDSMDKLAGISIMTDHEMNTGNVLGSVKSVEWQNAYTVGNLKVPAGLNVKLAIDGKSHPQIARGLLMDPPSYHSVSVTVSFAWKWSHTLKDDQSEYGLWGTVMEDGKVFRKIATEIKFYAEISIVPLGADPFARILKDGKITHTQQVLDRQSLSAVLPVEGMLDTAQYDFKNTTNFSEIIINPNKKDDMELKEFMLKLGLAEDTTLDQLTLSIQEGVTAKDSLANLIAKKSDLSDESLTALIDNQKTEADTATLKFVTDNGGSEELTAAVELNTANLTAKRLEAVNFYKLSKGDDAKDAIIASIDESTGEALEAFREEFKTEFEAKVPLTCQDCGSASVSRKSSGHSDNTTDKLSLKEAMYQRQMKAGVERIHGKSSN